MTYVATAAECGSNWTENLAFAPRNLPWPEFGCSTQHNFAAIVANPRDLIEPLTSVLRMRCDARQSWRGTAKAFPLGHWTTPTRTAETSAASQRSDVSESV
ncbi:MAG: hypothetical protein HC794_08815 [Nitrospiraceae bacterium]|nr:hypothetical protein [Nitrospiraceae bacterium]